MDKKMLKLNENTLNTLNILIICLTIIDIVIKIYYHHTEILRNINLLRITLVRLFNVLPEDFKIGIIILLYYKIIMCMMKILKCINVKTKAFIRIAYCTLALVLGIYLLCHYHFESVLCNMFYIFSVVMLILCAIIQGVYVDCKNVKNN